MGDYMDNGCIVFSACFSARIFRTVSAVLLVLSFYTGGPALGQQPSFDCATSRHLDETTICGDPSLAQLDRALDDLFATALNRLDEKQKPALRDSQRQWLRQRAACGRDVSCINRLYAQRIPQVRALASAQSVPALATPSVDDILKANGRWISDFNIDFNASTLPKVFQHYFIYTRGDDDYTAPGAIVTGMDWDPTKPASQWRIVHGSLKDTPDDSWYIHGSFLTYLGPEWKPEFAQLSDAVFSRLNGKNLGKKINHETVAAVASLPGQSDQPGLATLSVEKVLKAKGRWVSDFNIDLKSPTPSKVFEHYFIYVGEDNNYTSPGAIVTGKRWSNAYSSEWRIVHGTLKDTPDNSWGIYGRNLTYLGPEWKPEFARLSDAVFTQLKGKKLRMTITHN
jgi:uncharacterized protein